MVFLYAVNSDSENITTNLKGAYEMVLELQRQGYGDKDVVFDNIYATNDIMYSEKEDEILMY